MSDALRHAVAELAGDLRAWLEYAQDTGAEFLPWEPPQARQAPQYAAQAAPSSPSPQGGEQREARAPQSRPKTRPPQDRPRTQPSAGRGQSPSQGAALDALRSSLGVCPLCGVNHGQEGNLFGVGDPRATLVVIGERAGKDEALAQEPFVGRSGQLMTRMLQAIGVQRDEAYLCYALKCRQAPAIAEAFESERELLKQQIEAIAPKAILCSGLEVSQALLGLNTPLDELRHGSHHFQGIPLIPMEAPETLLMEPGGKKKAYDDLLKLKSILKRG